MVAPHDQRMQFPNLSLVFGQAAYPTEQEIVIGHRTREAVADNAVYFISRTSECWPAIRLVKVFNKEDRGVFEDRFRLFGEIDNSHGVAARPAHGCSSTAPAVPLAPLALLHGLDISADDGAE